MSKLTKQYPIEKLRGCVKERKIMSKLVKEEASILKPDKVIKRNSLPKVKPLVFEDLPKFFCKNILDKETKKEFYVEKIVLSFPHSTLEYTGVYPRPEFVFHLREDNAVLHIVFSESILAEYMFPDGTPCGVFK